MVQLTPNMPYLTLRLKFYKKGSLQYISHLDLVRTMHKVIVRAKLPLWYTEGFNPKPKLIFAAPLSIGTESECEFVDIRLVDELEPGEAMRRLNENMSDEMQVVKAYYPDAKLTDLKWLGYRMRIKTNGADDALAKKANELFLGDEVWVTKKARGTAAPAKMNIRPLVKSVKTEYDGKSLVVDAVLSADSSSFLNPEYIISALREHLGVLSDPCLTNENYSILRQEAFRGDMSEFL